MHNGGGAPKARLGGRMQRFPHLAGDMRGGFASALVGLPYAVTSAMLAFAPLGAGWVGHGMLAGLVTALLAGIVGALLSGTPCQINGPRASAAVLMAGLIASVSVHPALQGVGGADPRRVLAVALVCVALAGAVQVAFGLLRMGSMVRFLPYPVISGFMVGLGLLVAGPQVPAMLGVTEADGWSRLWRTPGVQLGALAVGLLTIIVFVQVRKRFPRVPAPVAAVLAGTALHYLMKLFAPGAVGATAWDTFASSTVPAMPWLAPDHGLGGELAWVLTDMLPSILAIAFVMSLETLLSSSVLSIASNMRYDSRRELICQGVSNMASAAAGGVVSSGAPFRGVTNFNAGGRTRFASLVNGVLIGGVGLLATPLLFAMPLAAWAAILVVVGWDVCSAWARRLAGNPRADIAIGFVVAFATLTLGTAAAMLVGVAGSIALYVYSTSRAPIRGHFDGSTRTSQRVRPERHMEHLRRQGAAIRVIELQGSLFFGTADRSGREIEGLAEGVRYLVIDLRRVIEVDATGALVLMQTLRRVSEQGTKVALAAVSPGGRRGRVLQMAGLAKIVPAQAWHLDVDHALEQAETALLQDHSVSDPEAGELPLAALDLCADMSPGEVEGVARYLQRCEHPDGAGLFREGESGDRMYLIARGAVTVRVRLHRRDRVRRLATYSAGVIVGEMAVLEGKARSAEAVCEGPTVVLVLDRAALVRMSRDMPGLYGRLMFNLSRQLASRLRATTLELRSVLD